MRMYCGPSPRMRALANHERLTLRSLDASLGVSRLKTGAAGLCGKPAAGEGCEVIGFVPLARCAEALTARTSGPSPAKMEHLQAWATATNLVNAKGNFVVVFSRDYPCCVRGACSARRRLENASPPGGMSRARGLRPEANPLGVRIQLCDLCTESA
jgi:hypothetical protein